MKIRIATRRSLAMLQTHEVLEHIKLCNLNAVVRLLKWNQRVILQMHLAYWRKGLFVSKLESALANGC